MNFLLPPGSGRWQTIWGMDRHEWGTFHFWIAVIFMAILVVHLILHFPWIVSVVKGRSQQYSGARLAFGIVGFVAILTLAVAPIIVGVEENPVLRGQGKHRASTSVIGGEQK